VIFLLNNFADENQIRVIWLFIVLIIYIKFIIKLCKKDLVFGKPN